MLCRALYIINLLYYWLLYSTFVIQILVGRWKRTRDNAIQWHPHYVHRVVRALRQCLSLKPAEADLILTQEDVTHKGHSESEDSEFDEDGKPKYEVIKRKERLQNEADRKIEREILRGQELVPTGKKKKKKKRKKAKDLAPGEVEEDDWEDVEQASRSVRDISKRKEQMEEERVFGKNEAEKGLGPVAMRRKLFTRGHFRRQSRLLHKGCGERV